MENKIENLINTLPDDLKNKAFYYLSHPTADMIRERVEKLRLNRTIAIDIGDNGLSLEFDMLDLFITEHFIKLKCDRQRRLWKYKFLSADSIIQTLLNGDTSSDEFDSDSS